MTASSKIDSINTLINDTILRACRGESVDWTPVWLHRQAGGYLPEYQTCKKKSGLTFFELIKNPELVAIITLQPLERFKLDAVVLYSDILVIQTALGFHVELKSKGIEMGATLSNPSDVPKRILQVSVDEVTQNLAYVYESIKATLIPLNGRVPLIGFAGAPWTLMGYIVDGVPAADASGKTDDSKRFVIAKSWFKTHPEVAKQMLDKLAEFIAYHLIAQVKAGCHLLEVFDSWAALLDVATYRQFAIPALTRVVQLVKAECPNVPIIGFAKGANLADLAEVGFNVISIDEDTDLSVAKALLLDGKGIGIQGNFHPDTILKSREVIEQEAKKMIQTMGDQRRYIANLGHGCLPSFNPDHVGFFVDAVHKYSSEAIKLKSVDLDLASFVLNPDSPEGVTIKSIECIERPTISDATASELGDLITQMTIAPSSDTNANYGIESVTSAALTETPLTTGYHVVQEDA